MDNSSNMFSANNKLFVNASKEGVVKFHIMGHESDPWFLSAGGSKNPAMQTHMQNPQRPGVSYVKITASKVVCAIGNILRVYSFDLSD